MKLDKIETIVYEFYLKFNPSGLRSLINRFKLGRLQEKIKWRD